MLMSPKLIKNSHKAHNIVASLVMADAERTLWDELRYLDAKTRSAHDIIESGRKAMETLLLSDVLSSEKPLVEYMCNLIVEYIDDTLRRKGHDDITLLDCTHECHTADGVYVMTIRRVYRDADNIAVEYSDHLPEGTAPDTFYGDHLDAFSIDELLAIATALNPYPKEEQDD